MSAGKYILDERARKELLEEVDGLSYFVFEESELFYLIAQVDFLQKLGWTVSGHFCAMQEAAGYSATYLQPMKNSDNLSVVEFLSD